MRVRHRVSGTQASPLQMTSMIDIVFLLLVFFIMTFKVVIPEGDFNLKMPLTQPGNAAPSIVELPPVLVQLRADEAGNLTSIQLNNIGLGADFSALRAQLMSLIGPERGRGTLAETAEVQIDCDYGLRYEYVIQAITSISGYRADDGSIVKIIEKIKFTPPVRQAI